MIRAVAPEAEGIMAMAEAQRSAVPIYDEFDVKAAHVYSLTTHGGPSRAQDAIAEYLREFARDIENSLVLRAMGNGA